MSAQRKGYLLIDHSASPGIDEGTALQVGLDPTLVGEGKRLEADTLTCAHCKGVVLRNPFRTRERASCPKCGHHYICDGCEFLSRQPDYIHLPFTKLRDETLEAGARGLGSPRTLLFPKEPT